MNLTIGSGDVTQLLSGTQTKGFAELLQKFVAHDKPYYNAFASPIDALRTGAILEAKYLEVLSDDYYVQYKSICEELDCLTSSIDFAQIKAGEIVDFDELKTIYLTDFIDKIIPLKDKTQEEKIAVIKKAFKSNYNQVQFQLLTSGLDSANLVFLLVETYEDSENYFRTIVLNDFIKFRITRDEKVISEIKSRAKIFQAIKNFVISEMEVKL